MDLTKAPGAVSAAPTTWEPEPERLDGWACTGVPWRPPRDAWSNDPDRTTRREGCGL